MQSGVLYIDDEINNLNSFKALLRKDFTIYTAVSAKEGRQILDNHEIGVIVTDQRMPETTGIEFLESIIPLYPDSIRIILSGFSDVNVVLEALNRGHIYKYLVKPWQTEELRMDLKNALEIYSLRKENKILIRKLQQADFDLNNINKADK